jgi:hypothetical protein
MSISLLSDRAASTVTKNGRERALSARSSIYLSINRRGGFYDSQKRNKNVRVYNHNNNKR